MKLKNKILIILVGILLITNLLLLNKLESYGNNIYSINNQIHSLQSEIRNLSSTINDLNRKEKLISTYNYDIKNYKDYKKAKVTVNVTLNKLKENSKVFFMYKTFESDDSNWNYKELNNTGGLNYKTQLDLSYNNNYKTQILIDNNNEKQTGNIRSINLKDKLRDRIDMKALPKRADTNGNLTFEVNVRNNYNKYNYDNNEKLKLKEIKCFIYFENKLVHTVDIIKEGEKKSFSHVTLEEWKFEDSIRINEMGNYDGDSFMEPLTIKLMVKDMLDKEYTYKHSERY
ncbi:MAG: hypothetical protein FH753_09510 [Firmicutes bacterium]|nr:hypothetical protein [Bacillota bacterium]